MNYQKEDTLIQEQKIPEKLISEQIKELRIKINNYYQKIPIDLREVPEIQKLCLGYLSEAEKSLSKEDIISCRIALTQIEIELYRAKNAFRSFAIVVFIIYFFAIFPLLAYRGNWFGIQQLELLKILVADGMTPEQLNETLFIGIPIPIWFWSIIGSFTSMLLRASYFPFRNSNEALRWLLARPIIGINMGVLTYLMLISGLIVFAGNSTSIQTPQLLWVIAFIGSFSDTLSINLLQNILGDLQVIKKINKENVNQEKTNTEKNI